MTIYQRRDGYGWILDLRAIPGGKRRTFPTKDEAEGELSRLKREADLAGYRVATLPAETRARWLALEDQCRAVGSSLEAAAAAWLASRADGGVPVLAWEVLARWERDRREVRSPRYVAAVRGAWSELVADVAEAEGVAVDGLAVRAITRGHLARHLARTEWAAGTRRSRLAMLSAVLGYALRHGLLDANPADQVPRPELSMPDEVRFLTVDEARRLLGVVRDSGQGDLLASLVLAMFCGMRNEELNRAAVGDVDLDAGEIVVPLGKVGSRLIAGRRSRKRRVIEMEPCAVAWLEVAGLRGLPASSPVRRGGFRKRWEDVRAVAFPEGWPSNCLRKTYATHHYGLFRDASRLQANLGHDSGDVLHQHYCGIARKADAVAFWGLVPGDLVNMSKRGPLRGPLLA